MNQVPLIAYHAQCPDGFGSAWWLGKHLGPHEKVACYYDQPFPDCADRDVWSVDFCPKADQLLRVKEECQTLTIFDHHASQVAEVDAAGIRRHDNMHAYSDLSELGGLGRCEAVMDMNHSGVGLVSAYVRRWRGIEPPAFLAYIEDRDLWRFEMVDTPFVFATVTSHPYADEAWDDLERTTMADVIGQGRGIERYRQKLISSIVQTAHLMVIGTEEVWVCASPYAVGSDVAHMLCLLDRSKSFAGYYVVNDFGGEIGPDGHERPTKLKFGLRSLSDGADVSVIAKSMDPTGGGHVHAAGFSIEV